MYEAYAAVERAYSQGRYDSALQLAQGLLATLDATPDATPDASADEPLRPRLLLLMGHCHLYGLADPQQAAAAYRNVLERCNEPVLIEIARDSLGRCTTGAPASAPGQANTGTPQASNQASKQATPATPWLAQSTGTSNFTPAPPATTGPPETRTEAAAAGPQIKAQPEPQPVPKPEPEPEPVAEPEPETKPTPKPELIIPELVSEPEPPARPSSGFSREEEEDLARGLLLVEL